MKKLLTHKSNAYGLVQLEEGEEITEIGLFGEEMLTQIIDFCKSFEKFNPEYDTMRLRFGFVVAKDGTKLLALQPKNLIGVAWVVLAPCIEG